MIAATIIERFCERAVQAARYQGHGSRFEDIWANHDAGRTRITGEVGSSLFGIDIPCIVEGDDLDILLAALATAAGFAICASAHRQECAT